MNILLTNDDGYLAPGLRALYEQLKRVHDVVVVAPDGERSAVGHGLTINEPLRVEKVKVNGQDLGYAVNGKPADCVKLALFDICRETPDLVISGINAGSNTGVNIHYSGTVGAAREAALNGLLSIAVSIAYGDVMDFKGMAAYVEKIVDRVHRLGLPRKTFLNINAPGIPFRKIKGAKVTRQSMENISNYFEKRQDPRDTPYYWYGRMLPVSKDAETDDAVIGEQYVSITPIQCDITNYGVMDELCTELINSEILEK